MGCLTAGLRRMKTRCICGGLLDWGGGAVQGGKCVMGCVCHFFFPLFLLVYHSTRCWQRTLSAQNDVNSQICPDSDRRSSELLPADPVGSPSPSRQNGEGTSMTSDCDTAESGSSLSTVMSDSGSLSQDNEAAMSCWCCCCLIYRHGNASWSAC